MEDLILLAVQAVLDLEDHRLQAGDKRIADIYFGEFLRLYSHYAFREAVKNYMDKKKKGSPDDWKPQYLIDDDGWMAPYFDPADSGARYLRRVYFAGPMAV